MSTQANSRRPAANTKNAAPQLSFPTIAKHLAALLDEVYARIQVPKGASELDLTQDALLGMWQVHFLVQRQRQRTDKTLPITVSLTSPLYRGPTEFSLPLSKSRGVLQFPSRPTELVFERVSQLLALAALVGPPMQEVLSCSLNVNGVIINETSILEED